MYRLSTAGFVPPSVYIKFALFVLPEKRPGNNCPSSGNKKGGCLLGEPSRGRPAIPPCAAPSRPACGMSRFSIRQLQVIFHLNRCRTCRIQNPDTPRASRVARRTAGRLGGAGSAGLFAQDTNVPRDFGGIEDNCPERLFGSTNKGIPM